MQWLRYTPKSSGRARLEWFSFYRELEEEWYSVGRLLSYTRSISPLSLSLEGRYRRTVSKQENKGNVRGLQDAVYTRGVGANKRVILRVARAR